MKTFRGTLVFAVLVALFGGYAYYDFAKTQKETDQKSDAEKVVKFKTPDIQSIELKTPKGEMSWQRKDAKWTSSRPFVDEAEMETMNSYLDSITSEKAQELKPADGRAISWKDYSLDEPLGGDLTLKNSSGDSLRVQISRTASFDGQYYLRLGDQLFLGTSGWNRIAEKTPGQLRNRKLMRTSGTAEKIHLEFTNQKAPAVTLDLGLQAGGKWLLKGQPGLKIDSAKVEKYLGDLRDSRALDFLANTATANDLAKHGLQRPALKLRIDFRPGGGREGIWQLDLADLKDGAVAAKSSDADGILKLSEYESVQFRKKIEDFRDTKAPFELALESVQEVSIRNVTKSLVIRKDGSDWKLAKPQANEVLDQEKLAKIFEQMKSWEAKRFLPKGQTAMAPAMKELIFKDSQGKNLLKVEIGEDLKSDSKQGSSEAEAMKVVRSNLDQGLLAVSSKLIDQLPLAELVKTDEQKPQEQKPEASQPKPRNSDEVVGEPPPQNKEGSK